MDHTTTQIYNSKRRDPSSGKPHFCGDTLVSLYIKILFNLQKIWVYFVSMSTERVFAWIIKASLQNLFYYAIVTHLHGHIRIYTYLNIKNIRNQTGTISQQMRHASQKVVISLPLKESNYILFSVHWHWHSVSTLTVLTQYGYGPYSNIIFHEHYHSKRHLLKLERVHPNSNILERVHPNSNMTFK